jgi:hypothetical protein
VAEARARREAAVRRWKRPLLILSLCVAALAGGLGAWLWARRALGAPPPTRARLDGLIAERDALQASFQQKVVTRRENSLKDAPRGGVMIGLPTSLTESIIGQVVTGLFGETTLTLRDLKVHKEGEVRVKMLVRKRTLGTYVLDVQIHEVQGILRPGTPDLAFGPGRIDLKLPVRLAEGRGNAQLRFRWDSKGLAANAVCGDLDVTRSVSGGVEPKDYVVTGSFAIAASGNAITLGPRFPDLAMRVFVDPSDDAWKIVDGVIEEQRKGCEIALNKVDLKEKLGGILGKGFNVKIPQKIFKPIRLPAGVSQSLDVQGIKLALAVKPTGLLVARDRIWYGAEVAVSKTPKAK